MRNLHELDQWRITSADIKRRFGSYGDMNAGAFIVHPPGPDLSLRLKCLASAGENWDHVSVSPDGPKRTPTWAEMDWVKRLFFLPHEVAMQLHVAEEDHISIHPYVLHLWRPHAGLQIPLPPRHFV